jgi:iron complex outermembrane receptor protein
MPGPTRLTLILSVSALALAVAAPAMAQTQTQPKPDDSLTIDTLVVTAQRREETANSVGMPIQAFSGETLQQLRVTDPKDLSSVAPSFTVSQSYQGVPTYTLRGIGFNTINLSATSTVGTYTDEVAYAYPFMNTGPMFDLERVEVLKGPQGTLYGRNTTAGLIDFVTNKPSPSSKARWRRRRQLQDPQSSRARQRVRWATTSRRAAFRMEDSDEGWQVSNSRGERQGEVHRDGLALGPGHAAHRQPRDRRLIFRLAQQVRHRRGPGHRLHAGHGRQSLQRPRPGHLHRQPRARPRPARPTGRRWHARAADIGTGLGHRRPAREENTDFHAASCA